MADVRRSSFDLVPKPDGICSFCIQLYIYIVFDSKSVQQVSKHRHFTMVCCVKGISAKTLASNEDISVFLTIIHQQQRPGSSMCTCLYDPARKRVCPCSETCC